MCLGIPGLIVKIDSHENKLATVDVISRGEPHRAHETASHGRVQRPVVIGPDRSGGETTADPAGFPAGFAATGGPSEPPTLIRADEVGSYVLTGPGGTQISTPARAIVPSANPCSTRIKIRTMGENHPAVA